MRKFNIFVIALAMAFCFSVAFCNDAEARNNKRNVCTCATPTGTLFNGCHKHGNACVGYPTHEHENTRGRRTDLPTFCKSGNFKSLEDAPTCDGFKERVRLAKQQAKKSNNGGLFANILGDNYVTKQYDNRVKHNVNRIKTNVKRNIREDARRNVDCLFGICR